MRPRTFIVLALAALLGAGVAVLASISSSAASSAASPTATVTGTEGIMWSPMEVTIAAGGTVTFSDPSKKVPHGVVWQSGPETPSCSGVPIDSGATDWTGTCTFVQAGTYYYYCYVHGNVMSGVIHVEGAGTTTSTGTTETTGTAGGGDETPGGGYGSTNPTSAAGQPPPSGSSTPTANTTRGDSLGAGALILRTRQRRDVRGSLSVAQQGSTLRVTLLLARGELGAHAHRRGTILAGQLLRSGLAAGRIAFEVPLDARARAALRRRGKLALLTQITLVPPGGAGLHRTLDVEITR